MTLWEFLIAVAITVAVIAIIAALCIGWRNARAIEQMEGRINLMCKAENNVEKRVSALEARRYRKY